MNASDATEMALARLAKAETLSIKAQRIAGVGTWQFDPESGLVIWSREVFRIFGVSAETFQPSLESFMECVHPEDRGTMTNVVKETLGGKPMDFTHRIVRPDGEIRHVRDRARMVILEEGHPLVMVGTVQDITERRRAEEVISHQTRQLKEMQADLVYLARQSAMGTMAATLAHELNQPLAAIGNYAAGVKRLVSADREATAGVEEIEKNAARAGEIIRRLRDMTRRGTTNYARTNIAEIIKDALTLVGRGACADTNLDCHIAGAQFVEADPIQIGQVVINLVKNACEAVEDQKIRKVIIETSILGDSIQVSVSDTGPGIAPEALPVIFDGCTSTKPNGMGLGLSISRTIVEGHGGNIGAENSADGARFWFTLPRAEPTPHIGGERSLHRR